MSLIIKMIVFWHKNNLGGYVVGFVKKKKMSELFFNWKTSNVNFHFKNYEKVSFFKKSCSCVLYHSVILLIVYT